MEQKHLEIALEKMDMTTFDVFHSETIFNENSLQFMAYKIFKQHQLFSSLASNFKILSVLFVRSPKATSKKTSTTTNSTSLTPYRVLTS